LSARNPEPARAQRTGTTVAAAARHRSSRRALRPAVETGPRHNVPEAQRARVLAATVQIVAEVGCAGLSVTNVVDLARVSRATFYELFSDREELFLAAFDEAVAQLETEAAVAYATGAAWEERLRAGLETVLGALDEEPALARLCVVEAQRAGTRVQRSSLRGAAPPPLTAHSLVAGALWAVHERLLADDAGPLSELAGPLMSMIVFPYRGPAAAARELRRPARRPREHSVGRPERMLAAEDWGSRLTYRTLRALTFVAEHPGANNREVADGVGISDKGPISKLLVRLASLGLIENTVDTRRRGVANIWRITPKGERLRRTVKA
jgi:AcrR family transcriptional regulator